MTLRVLDPGLYTLVVDFGRPHCRSLGVPVGGAADRTSLAIGNALVGNPPDAAGLEITLAGPTLEAECELACVVYGAPFELTSDRHRLRDGRTFTLCPGERLRIGGTRTRVRAYLCVQGGLQTPLVLNSRSGLQPVRADEELPCSPGRIHPRSAPMSLNWRRESERLASWPDKPFLQIVDGPQADWFPKDLLVPENQVTPPLFAIRQESNRMGLRLQGAPLSVPERELVSEPVCPGAVQVTRDGQCIILGVDGQTIGGYPKIAQVVSADLDELGQLRPGSQLYFERISLDRAADLYRRKQAELRAWLIRLRTSLDAFPSLAQAAAPDTKNDEPTINPEENPAHESSDYPRNPGRG
jgi:antagonist of KipI